MTVIGDLQGLLEYFRDERHRREDKADEALMAIYVAANETKLYIQKVNETGKSDRKTEEELSRLWVKAAVPISHFNQDLADRCMMKGDYWINPKAWTGEQIVEFKIGIDEVYSEARDLLKKIK